MSLISSRHHADQRGGRRPGRDGPRRLPARDDTPIRRDSLRGPWDAGQRARGSAYSWIGVWERQGRSESWIAQQLLVSVDELRRWRERATGPEQGSEGASAPPRRRFAATSHGSVPRPGSPSAARAAPREAMPAPAELLALASAAARSQARDAERADATRELLEELEAVVAVLREELRSLGGRNQVLAPQAPSAAGNGTRLLSLATVSAGELQSLGLTRTQAQRLVCARERGQAGSVADIDSVPGFPRAVRRILGDALVD